MFTSSRITEPYAWSPSRKNSGLISPCSSPRIFIDSSRPSPWCNLTSGICLTACLSFPQDVPRARTLWKINRVYLCDYFKPSRYFKEYARDFPTLGAPLKNVCWPQPTNRSRHQEQLVQGIRVHTDYRINRSTMKSEMIHLSTSNWLPFVLGVASADERHAPNLPPNLRIFLMSDMPSTLKRHTLSQSHWALRRMVTRGSRDLLQFLTKPFSARGLCPTNIIEQRIFCTPVPKPFLKAEFLLLSSQLIGKSRVPRMAGEAQ